MLLQVLLCSLCSLSSQRLCGTLSREQSAWRVSHRILQCPDMALALLFGWMYTMTCWDPEEKPADAVQEQSMQR